MDGKYVFISYKADEFDQAKTVKDHLENNGIPCWMAPMSIRGGSSYAQEIPQAIKDCSVVVLMLSEKAQESKWVPREVDQAINCEKVLMPYMLEDCPLRSDFSFYLTNVQRYEAFRDPEETLERMTRDIQKLLNITPPPVVEEPEVTAEPEAPKAPKLPVPVKAPKQKKKPAGKKKKLPWILAGALLAVVLLIVLLIPGKVRIGGVDFAADAYSVRLENVTLTQGDINKFSKLSELAVIELNNCTIEAQNLQPMTGEELYELRLENCKLTDAQVSTLSFAQLRYLSVRGNGAVTALPGLEACADRLTELDISDTGIKEFSWISGFTELKILRADRTGMQADATLEPLIYLEELSLSGNGLANLDGLKNTSKLTKVDLSHNNLTEVKILDRNLACLQELRLEHNQLMFLDCLAGGKELRKVYVDGNKLYDLNWLKESKNLRVLSASQNRISSLTDLGIGMELRYLNLAENNLESIASGDLVFGEDNYLVVDLRNNRLQTLELPQNCTYTQLAVLGNPELDIGTLKALKGGELFFELFPELTVQKLEALSFNYLCIVNCPLDRQVEMEEHFYSAKLLTQEEALEQIAENAENATY